MIATRLNVALGAVLFLFLSVPVSAAQSAKQADSAAIQHAVMGLETAWNHHNAAALAAFYAEDADLTNLAGLYIHGRKGIEAHLAMLYRGPFKNASRHDTVRSIRMLTPTLALVDVYTSTVTGAKAADGSPTPPVKGLMSLVMAKQGGRWLIVVFHEQDFPSGPAPAAPTGK
ncbi:MAG TPA: SgcJ/EcaC family oxidoreductase [Candidatus Dormibacteraeota bacterium]|nr:SgcJ/EcaC family oxidoreductase [Candidatus Dormibacteraeota bacterium]